MDLGDENNIKHIKTLIKTKVAIMDAQTETKFAVNITLTEIMIE